MDITFLQAAVQTPVIDVHAGEFPAEAIGEIGVLAGMLGRMFLPLIPKVSDDDRLQRLLVMGISALALGLYVREAQVAVIGHGFTIVTSFCTVALTTLGMFNLVDPENFTKDNMKALASSATLGVVKAPPSDPKP